MFSFFQYMNIVRQLCETKHGFRKFVWSRLVLDVWSRHFSLPFDVWRVVERTDDMYLGRDDFAGSIDLFRREEIRHWKHLKTSKFISLFQILFRFKDNLYAANPVRKPVAWQESTTLTLSTAERSQQVSIGAFVVPRWMAANDWLYKSFLIFSLCFFCVSRGIKQKDLKGCFVSCVFCTFSHRLEE